MERLLLAGDSLTGKKQLIQCLQERSSSESLDFHELVTIHHATVYPMPLQTKYFHTCLQLTLLKDAKKIFSEKSFSLTDVQGLILVFDITKPSTFDYVKSIWESIKLYDSNDDNLPPFRILVGSHLDDVNESDYMEGRSLFVEWSLDNGFEFIDANLKDRLFTSNDRDKEGVARVKEALESHVWKNVIQLKRENNNNNNNDNKKEEKRNNNFVSVSQEIKEENTSVEGEEDGEDIDFEMFAKMIAEVKRVKEEAKDLPDDIRRERAGEMALKMMMMLGLDKDDDDDEEEGNVGGEEENC